MTVEIYKKYFLGDYELDPANHLLRRGHVPISLSRKKFQILLYLVEHKGRLVTREELLARFWDGSEVYEENLTKCVSEIRKALADQTKPHKFIDTVPAVGYRFIGPCAEAPLTPEPSIFAVEKTRGVRVVIDEEDEVRLANFEPGGHSTELVNGKRSSFYQSNRGKVWVAGAAILVAAFAFVFYKLVFTRRATQSAGSMAGPGSLLRTSQVTSWSGLDLFPSFSPDGSSIAYSSDRTGNFEIYVKTMAPGGRDIQITFDNQQNLEPAWSPDGKLIAYYSKNRRGIWLIPALGGVARQLTEFGSYPAWSRDGGLMAFQSVGIGDVLSVSSGAALPSSTIWVVATQGGTPKQVTEAGKPPGGHGAPAWSPDGRRISFTAYDLSKSPEVWTIATDGSDVTLIAQHAFEFVYAPDGRSIYFTGSSKDLGYGVWNVQIDSNGRVLSNPNKIFDPGATTLKHLSRSADGKRLIYASLLQTSNLWSVSLSPVSQEAIGSPTALTRETTYRSTGPAFSPDGRRIAYSAIRAGAKPSVWLMNSDGTNQTELTSEGGGPLNWSPDGNELVFTLQRDARAALWSVPIGGGKEKQVIDLGTDTSFQRLSPDGQKLIFNQIQNGVTNLWIRSLGDAQSRQLTFDAEGTGFASWSPDGKQLAVGIKRGEDNYVGVMSSTGGSVTQLNFEHGFSAPSSWSPDGDKIVFASNRNGSWNIYWISRTTRQQKQLTDYKKTNILLRYPAWSPLGNQIAYEYGETTGNIWLMELR